MLPASEYAPRCAVRVLLFLVAPGNFDYWDDGGSEKNLYAIIQVVDTATFVTYQKKRYPRHGLFYLLSEWMKIAMPFS